MREDERDGSWEVPAERGRGRKPSRIEIAGIRYADLLNRHLFAGSRGLDNSKTVGLRAGCVISMFLTRTHLAGGISQEKIRRGHRCRNAPAGSRGKKWGQSILPPI